MYLKIRKYFSKRSQKNQFRLGVVFSTKEMIFVLAERSPIEGDGIVDFQKVPLPKKDMEETELVALVKFSLKKFLKDRKNVEIWTSVQSNKVETKIFEIPAVKKSLIANAAIWGIKKNTEMDPLETLFDYRVIEKIEGENGGKYRIQGYAAPKKEIWRVQDIFKSAGFPLTGITVATFGIQNILKRRVKDARNKNLCVFFVGRDWSRIDIYVGGVLTLSRDIKTGFNSLLEAIQHKIKDGYLTKLLDN